MAQQALGGPRCCQEKLMLDTSADSATMLAGLCHGETAGTRTTSASVIAVAANSQSWQSVERSDTLSEFGVLEYPVADNAEWEWL